ncbi:MAG: ATP-binding protein [Gemmatimonadota bacterium]
MRSRPGSPPTLGDDAPPETDSAEREVRSRLFVRGLEDYAIALLDERGRVVSWNRGAERTTGRAESEVLGLHLAGACGGADAGVAEAEEQLRAARERGRCATERWRFRADGTRYWSRELLIPLRDASRRLVGYGRIWRDRTVQKRWAEVQSVLAEAGEILASSLDYDSTVRSVARLAVPRLADWCAIGALGSEGTLRPVEIAATDPRREAALHELADEWSDWVRTAGHPVTRALRTGRAQVVPTVTEAMLGAFAPGATRSGNVVRELAPRSAIVAPMIARGRKLGVIVLIATESGRRYGREDLPIVIELAHRAALAIDNARLYREARDATRARDEMQRVVAHELRSPLNAIGMALRLLRHQGAAVGEADGRADADAGGDTPDRRTELERRAIRIAERAAEHMRRLIGDMLEIGRIEGQGLRLERAAEDAASIVDEAIQIHREAADERAIALDRHIESGLPAVRVDRGRVIQVFSNLIENALKFTPEGGRVVVAADRAGESAREVRFRVADTGPGIPAEERRRIFDRFWRARRSDHSGGAGLGLAICKSIVEAHGGRLRVESEVGEGSTFLFTVPEA